MGKFNEEVKRIIEGYKLRLDSMNTKREELDDLKNRLKTEQENFDRDFSMDDDNNPAYMDRKEETEKKLKDLGKKTFEKQEELSDEENALKKDFSDMKSDLKKQINEERTELNEKYQIKKEKTKEKERDELNAAKDEELEKINDLKSKFLKNDDKYTFATANIKSRISERENKLNELDDKINELQNEIDELNAIDFEAEFSELSKIENVLDKPWTIEVVLNELEKIQETPELAEEIIEEPEIEELAEEEASEEELAEEVVVGEIDEDEIGHNGVDEEETVEEELYEEEPDEEEPAVEEIDEEEIDEEINEESKKCAELVKEFEELKVNKILAGELDLDSAKELYNRMREEFKKIKEKRNGMKDFKSNKAIARGEELKVLAEAGKELEGYIKEETKNKDVKMSDLSPEEQAKRVHDLADAGKDLQDRMKQEFENEDGEEKGVRQGDLPEGTWDNTFDNQEETNKTEVELSNEEKIKNTYMNLLGKSIAELQMMNIEGEDGKPIPRTYNAMFDAVNNVVEELYKRERENFENECMNIETEEDLNKAIDDIAKSYGDNLSFDAKAMLSNKIRIGLNKRFEEIRKAEKETKKEEMMISVENESKIKSLFGKIKNFFGDKIGKVKQKFETKKQDKGKEHDEGVHTPTAAELHTAFSEELNDKNYSTDGKGVIDKKPSEPQKETEMEIDDLN